MEIDNLLENIKQEDCLTLEVRNLVGNWFVGSQVDSDLLYEAKSIQTLCAKNYQLSEQASHSSFQRFDNLRKMLLSEARDPRALYLVLVNHLLKLKAVSEKNSKDALFLAQQGREIYAPMANILGIGELKWELEDLSFRLLEPNIYQKIARLLSETRCEREKYIKDIEGIVSKLLQKHNIDCDIKVRVKHIYSIWRKMQQKKLDYKNIYDIRAVRIIVGDVGTCYEVLGILQDFWKNIPSEFDDYIANPKPNGYQSLHAAVIAEQGKVLEVQIRTHQQDEYAHEY